MELAGETIEDYQCDGCNEKVLLKKRNLLGEMPNVLIVHQQRIELDLQTFEQKKVNSKFEFPNILDLNPYSFAKEHVGSVQPEAEEDREQL